MQRSVLMVGVLAMTCVTAHARSQNVSAFDGTWSETITGESPSCAGSFNTTFRIENGRLIQAGSHGQINPDGSARGAAAGNGFTLTWSGRFSGNTASGHYKRDDGCVGRWEAIKQ
jgi:hypothetical protein